MVGDELTNLSTKVNSGETHFTTSQSTHSKHHCSIMPPRSSQPHKKTSEALHQLGQDYRHSLDVHSGAQENHVTGRLFTFMDEKQGEKKFIQDFVYKHSTKSRQISQPLVQHNGNQENFGIVRLIEDSRKKREDFLKKIVRPNITVNQDKSQSKLKRINKSKTPKNLQCYQHKYETIDPPRGRSKTPKFDQNRSITPKYDRQLKIFRAKSSLQKDFKKLQFQVKCKQNKESIVYEQNRKNEKAIDLQLKAKLNHSQKEKEFHNLIKKKKQLEKQLMVVNSSLINCKKKPPKKIKACLTSRRQQKGQIKNSKVNME